ncbi:coniferyl aldehyde dehydrogenase [Vibrio gigantis]|uniref:coniferyl aldehyde dehydrogenase n=1 Tax=Vibrio gigantis TaxID=296199 RepID=UPI001BFD0EE4|nr:coniferyl aldehyde dehydrogenase [Vibrio gigantis]
MKHELTATQMTAMLKKMQEAFANDPMPTVPVRIEQLLALKSALIDYTDRLCTAVSEDYGHRSRQDTLMADILPCLGNIDHTIECLPHWSTSSIRHSGPLLSTSRVEVVYQPKGVVGIITPWNFPIMLSIGPLISALAAGNRAMIKMSEFTPATNHVLRQLLDEVFNADEVCLVEGEVEIAAAFSALPFDHLLFTGSTQVGRQVIVAEDMPVDIAVERIIYGKSLNNGQVCVAPDYVLLPEDKLEAFILEYKKQYQLLFDEGIYSENLTSLINPRQCDRIVGLLNDEQQAGTRIVACHDDAMDLDTHRLVTHLIVEPSLSSKVMNEEIFGPLLPLITYRNIDEAFQNINSKPRPLALYLMSFNSSLQSQVKQQVHSGGMCINDCVFHLAVDDAPFGGIGESGQGNYHGKEGFITFSHAKTVLETGLDHRVKYLFSKEDNELKTAVMNMLGK